MVAIPRGRFLASRPFVCLISSIFQLKCSIYPGLASHGGGWGFCIKGLCGPVAMIASSVNLSIPPVVSARLRGGGTGFSCLVLLLAAGQKIKIQYVREIMFLSNLVYPLSD